MKNKNYILVSFFVMLFAFSAFSQSRTITGNVIDENGDAAIAATIRVTGTDAGTVSDLDGNFSISVPADAQTLTISYIGKEPKVVRIQDNMEVVLLPSDNMIDAVVKVGLDQSKKAKDLTYSVTKIQADDVTQTSNNNVATALAGKVSGMQINTTNNGVSPDTRVILRGNRSLLNDNQALIVVDGYPSPRGVLDRINPNDIESMTILKGANASAIYGSEASNGAVIITTKKPVTKDLRVTYTGNYQLESVAFMPEFQDEFGVGGFPDGTLYPLENVNWGPRYDGRLVDASETYADGRVWQVPFTPIKDNHRNFFQTAPTSRNGLTLSSGGKEGTFLMSVDHSATDGIVPNDEYNRTNFRLKADKKINKLTVGGNLAFYRSQTDVVGNGGRQNRPVYWNIVNTPLHLPMTELKNWRDGEFTRNETSFFAFYENPYYIIDTQREQSKFNEFTAIGDMKYDFTDDIALTFRAGYTSGSSDFKRRFGEFTYAFDLPNPYSRLDEYGASTSSSLGASTRLNTDFFLTYNKQVNEDFKFNALVGHNYRNTTGKNVNVNGGQLIIPGFFDVSTRTGELGGSESISEYRRYGAYGSFDVGFKEYLVANFTGRNDWSSTLAPGKNSYFYSGGGLSFIPTDAFPEMTSDNGLSFLKISGNRAKTGRDPSVYQINNSFSANSGFPFANTTGLSLSSRESNPNLNPEFTFSNELGLEFALFDFRLEGNISVFKQNIEDQIITINTSLASGASSNLVNLGEVENKGIELDLSGAVISNRDKEMFWDISANYSSIQTEVLSLLEGVNEVAIGSGGGASIVARIGEPFPAIKTSAYATDDRGRVIVGANGDPIRADDLEIQGQTAPKYTVGLNTNFKYKGWNFYAAGDYRTGHVFFNDLVNALEFTGLSQHSVTSGRQPFVWPNSVYETTSGTFVENNNRLTTGGGNAFWDAYNEINSNYVTDATALKLREISISYSLPGQLIDKLKIQDIKIGAYGRNIYMRLPADNVYSDPEFNFTTGNTVGIGTQSQTPPTRSFGLNLNVEL